MLNRGFCSSIVLHRISLVCASGETFRRRVFDAFGECEEGLFPRRTVLWANGPARLRPATPPCAPTRPACGMSGFWTRQVQPILGWFTRAWTWILMIIIITSRVQNPDISRAGRVGAHGGLAGRIRAGLFAHRTVRLGNNPSSHSPKASKTSRLNVCPEARTSEMLCKPVESKTRTYHERVASVRTAEWRGGVGQDCSPIELCA